MGVGLHSSKTAVKIVDRIAKDIKNELFTKINEKKLKICVIVDETSTISNKPILIIFLKIVMPHHDNQRSHDTHDNQRSNIHNTTYSYIQYKISSFPIFLLTATLNTSIKWLSVIGAFPFGKHCDFLEGIACLRTGMTFSSAIIVSVALSFNSFPNFGPSEIN